jgi:hypothetical protein
MYGIVTIRGVRINHYCSTLQAVTLHVQITVRLYRTVRYTGTGMRYTNMLVPTGSTGLYVPVFLIHQSFNPSTVGKHAYSTVPLLVVVLLHLHGAYGTL